MAASSNSIEIFLTNTNSEWPQFALITNEIMDAKRTEWKSDILISAPLEKVWNVIYDVQLLPTYHPQVKSVEIISGGGKRSLDALYKYHDINDKGWCTEKVIQMEEYRRLIMIIVEDSEGLDKIFKDSTLEFLFEETPDLKTILKFRLYFFPIGFKGKVVQLLFGKRIKGTIDFTMRSIKNFVEQYS